MTMRKEKLLFCAALAIFACAGRPAASFAADIYVATTGNDTTGDGSAAAPFATIAKALETASPLGDDTIHVGPGLYEITAQLEVTNATTIIGMAGRDATEVRRAEVLATNKKPGPDFQSRCLYICHPDAKVEGITFSRGYLYCDSASDTTDRLLCRGSGVYIASGSLLSCAVTNCYIGRSKVGGALALQGANAFVSNCLVRANRSYGNSWENWGTGVIASGGEIVDSRICENVYVGSSYPRGTGLYIEKPPSGTTPVKVRRCQITGNSDNAASYLYYWGTAAGVQIMAPDALLENCLIAGNSTHGNGGGAYVNGARATFANCTIVDNSAQYGGGVHNSTTSGVVFWNCIIQGNTAESDTSAGAPEWRGGAASNFSYSLSPVGFPAGGVGNVTDTATFQPGGYQLAGGSAGFDTGSTTDYPWLADTVDLAGNARVWGDAIDMGCYEYSASGLDASLSASAEKVLLGGHVTLSALVVDAAGLGYSVAWYVDGAATPASTASTFEYAPVQVGKHTVSLVVTATGGTIYDGGTAVVVAIPPILNVVDPATHPETVPALPHDTVANALTNLLDAASLAMDGVTIRVHPGEHLVTNDVYLSEAIKVLSVSGPEATAVRNVSGKGRAFHLNNANAFVAGFSLSGMVWNEQNAKGVGVFINNNGGTVSNCHIRGNSVRTHMNIWGAGAYLTAGTMVDCEISGNLLSVSLRDLNYTVMAGGGVWMSGGDLRNCSIVSNVLSSFYPPRDIGSPTSHQQGGGIYASGGHLVNCLVACNSATNAAGGGLYANGDVIVSNCTFTANEAGTYGGGLLVASSESKYVNTAFVANLAAENGAQIWPRTSNVSFTACFAPKGDIPDTNGNVFGTDARFQNPAAGNFTPGRNSPLRNAGLYDASWMDGATDLAGNPRIDHYRGGRGLVDIGAFEAPYIPSATVILLR
jgi:hypothetical protein